MRVCTSNTPRGQGSHIESLDRIHIGCLRGPRCRGSASSPQFFNSCSSIFSHTRRAWIFSLPARSFCSDHFVEEPDLVRGLIRGSACFYRCATPYHTILNMHINTNHITYHHITPTLPCPHRHQKHTFPPCQPYHRHHHPYHHPHIRKIRFSHSSVAFVHMASL